MLPVPPRNKTSPEKKRRIPLYQGILILFGLTLVFSAIGGYYFWKNYLNPRPVPELPYEELEPRPPKEIFIPQPHPSRPETTFKPNLELPKIAIVIDDLGYDRHIAQEFIDLQAPLTLSFLPQAPHAKEMALLARKRGKGTLLHLPMEPLDYPRTNPGPGALLLSMSVNEILQIIDNDFNEFSFVQGANNHMGSRFTENREKMAVVLEFLKKRNLFFLDSLTTPQSVVPALAEDLGVKYLQRNIFLDNEVAEGPIRQQLEKLIQVAQARGFAVGCGHPYPLLLQVIRDQLPYLKNKVEIVSLSELIK
jgi:polysaccharide deacetylase 2 family uncharacterized protein YibQ